MIPGTSPLVVIAGDSVDPGLVTRLSDFRFRVEPRPLLVESRTWTEVGTLIVDGSLDPVPAYTFCKSMRARLGPETPPIILLTPAHPDARRAGLEQGADVCLNKPFTIDELHCQVEALLRWYEIRNRLQDKANLSNDINQQLQQAYSQINLDLKLARRLQSSFLPRQLPEVGRARFAVWSRPHGIVGGDFYDVFRLDERHVGFYLADAMGHGVPACLLTIYLKKAVMPKDLQPSGYRLLPPDEVLTRLNRDLIEQDMPEQPFFTMCYGLLDCFSGELSMARAAAPPPIMIRRDRPPELWKMTGTLLGVFEASFQTFRQNLQSGDRLLLMTDGLSAESPELERHDFEPVFGVIDKTRDQPLTAAVESIADQLISESKLRDDLTYLALEMHG